MLVITDFSCLCLLYNSYSLASAVLPEMYKNIHTSTMQKRIVQEIMGDDEIVVYSEAASGFEVQCIPAIVVFCYVVSSCSRQHQLFYFSMELAMIAKFSKYCAQ